MTLPAAPVRRVLVVCTANVCRSPVAERALAREWAAVGVPVDVRSAGVSGGRLDVHRSTLEAAGFAHLDLSDHRSRALTPDMVDTEGADLIIGMTRDHVHTIVARHPDCWTRAFTLRELARRSAALADISPASSDWDAWLAACGHDRDQRALFTSDRSPDPAHLLDDDLPDPYGRDAGEHILMVQEVVMHARTIAAAVAVPPRPDPAPNMAPRP
jgi:protein-tyrosine phosphatase